MIGWIILALIVALIVVIIARAAAFKPRPEAEVTI